MRNLRAICASAALLLAAAIGFHSTAARAQATQLPPAEVCFNGATTGISGLIGTLGTITIGSGGIAGTYTNVPLTGGSGTGATANITVSGGVTAMQIYNPGLNYAVGDVLSALSANIGGTIGFSVPVASISINGSLAGGSIGMYVPSTLTPKQTWQNAAQTINNTNPISLNANGCAIVYGTGTYRQILFDSLGNEVWDQLTSVAPANPYWAGLASGTANAIVVTDGSFIGTDGQCIQFFAAGTNTGATTINPNSYGNVPVVKNTSGGPAGLTGGEIVTGNNVTACFSATYSEFFLQAVAGSTSSAATIVPPGGRLTLASHTPVMSAAVTAASVVYYDSYVSNYVPYYNGVTDNLDTIAANEVSALITGAVSASQVADVWWAHGFGICFATNGSGLGWAGDGSGTNLQRGSGYTVLDITTRPYITNKNILTNCEQGATNVGPISANQATYLGTVATDSTGGTVTWTLGGALSGGVAPFLDVWNNYNRVDVTAFSIDSGTPYNFGSSLYSPARGSNGNQVNFVTGLAEDGISVEYTASFELTTVNGTLAQIAIGLDSVTAAALGDVPGVLSNMAPGGTVGIGSAISVAAISPQVGFHYMPALHAATSNSSVADFYSTDGLTARLRM